jgi:hypothetical protein
MKLPSFRTPGIAARSSRQVSAEMFSAPSEVGPMPQNADQQQNSSGRFEGAPDMGTTAEAI